MRFQGGDAPEITNPVFEGKTYDVLDYAEVGHPSTGPAAVYATIVDDEVGMAAFSEASVMEFPNRAAVEAALLASCGPVGTFCVRRSRTGSEVLSVVMLKMWVGGKPEEVSVIGLVMLVLVLLFRWVQLKVIKKRISTL